MSAGQSKARRGPPKAFDIEAALDAAMLVFWQKGFDGASLSDLTEAMAINRPSLYATFGDKQALFRRAIDRFSDLGRAMFAESAAQATARLFAQRLLRGQAELYSNPRLAPGCFLIQSAISASTATQAARQAAADRRLVNELAVRQHLQRADRIQQLPQGIPAREMAGYLTSVGNGLAIRAADGARRQELYRIVDLALAFWPVITAEPPKRAARKSPRAKASKTIA
ncbi:MAG TPA: helix-turn-helix domain-containing protein [Pirellulales bacterium]|jgi:AcrR family transcriptional regulator|nr:helix-turn-helix domain-containing protein [Pirellulales bacterium]